MANPSQRFNPKSAQERYLSSLSVLGRNPLSRSGAKRPLVDTVSEKLDSVVAWGWYVDGIRQPSADLSTAARRANAGEGFVWLGLKDPTDDDLQALSPQFNLHPLAVEDAVEGHTRSKLEMFGDDLFMVVSTIAYVEHEELTDSSEVVRTGQVMVFLSKHFVITVRRGEHAQLSELRHKMEADPTRLAQGPSTVLYAILDKIIDDYMAVTADFEEDVDELETRVFSKQGEHEVERVYQLKRELIEFKRGVVPLAQPLLRLATRDYSMIPHEARAYFRELSDHHTEAAEAVASFDEVLSSILTAGLARASVADNVDTRKISAWVAIVAVPTFMAGIWGMNFKYMPDLQLHYGYLFALGAMLVVMVGLYLGFKRNRWL